MILIGLSLTQECDECAKMESELKKAANMVSRTREKLSFGIISVNKPEDLKLQLKVDKFPSLVAIKEGLDPIMYNSTLDYL